jgi:hypothetical protein
MAAAVALFFGAVGCSDNSDDFKDQYNQAIRPLSSLGDDVAASLSSAGDTSDRALATQFEKLADRLDRTRENLSKLDPPEGSKEELDELLASLKQAAADTRAVAAAAREGDPAEGAEASEALVKTGQRVRKAEAEFKKAVD